MSWRVDCKLPWQRCGGHYVGNTGTTDLVVLEMSAAHEFEDLSLRNWIRRLLPEMVTSHFGLDAATIQSILAEKIEFVWGS
jgi:oxalate decarboxylase